MKKKKLHLKELKVKSFVTALNEEAQLDVKGGCVQERAKNANLFLPLEIRANAWTVSEIRRESNIDVEVNFEDRK